MKVAALLLTVLQSTQVASSGTACQSAESCFSTLKQRWELQLLDAAAVAPGTYSRRSGLDGDNLYLFEDGTFFSCHWNDDGVEESIEATGRWRVRRGVLELIASMKKPDPWYESRFVPVRGWQAQTGVQLVAVDGAYPFLYALAGRVWSPGQSTVTRKRLTSAMMKQRPALAERR